MKAERLRGDLHQVAVDTGSASCTALEPIVELNENRLRAGLLEALRGGPGIQRDGGRGF